MKIIEKYYRSFNREEVISIFTKVFENPDEYINDEVLGTIIQTLNEKPKEDDRMEIPLMENGNSYTVFGAEEIEQGAITQMEIAMRLPVTVAGALMPDAHQGLRIADWRCIGDTKCHHSLWSWCGYWLPNGLICF